MSYPPPTPPRPGGLPGLAVLLIVDLVLELAILGYDLNQKGIGYLGTASGFTYSEFANAPVGFFGSDFATCVALVVMIVAGFGGRGWIRPAGALLLSVNAYGTLQVITSQFTTPGSNADSFSKPFSNLLLNLDVLTQMVVALIFVIVVAATRRPSPAAPRPAFVPGQPGPYQGWQQPQPPVGYAPPQQAAYPAPQPQPQPGYAPPPPPQQPPTYGYPPAPTDAPPVP
ncbi:hypothetical protein P3T37_001997 [Kitasatospora sp. MAA4]|uniref:hypothetical protein n=1 Tax=Kitasatospora sp. MAA4 TaxID=3035093 RepID=UPI002475C467|nr:hypothetical protein [Kitasatospora sp. MAA4]MDH6132612.1 hypothetical protein [Kitasatospora sp. MAA4]